MFPCLFPFLRSVCCCLIPAHILCVFTFFFYCIPACRIVQPAEREAERIREAKEAFEARQRAEEYRKQRYVLRFVCLFLLNSYIHAVM